MYFFMIRVVVFVLVSIYFYYLIST